MKKLVVVFALSSALVHVTYAQDNAKVVEIGAAALNVELRAKLRAELETIFDTDQSGRKAINAAKTKDEKDALWEKQALIDTANQLRVEAIIRQYGWPRQTEFGVKASQAAFLVLQHAPIEIMKRNFLTLKTAMETGELKEESFALFEDRIRMYEGRPQIYGSQVAIDEKTGKPFIWMIEDEANVDKRRASMGMPPLSNYAKFFGIDYLSPAARKETAGSAVEPKSVEPKK